MSRAKARSSRIPLSRSSRTPALRGDCCLARGALAQLDASVLLRVRRALAYREGVARPAVERSAFESAADVSAARSCSCALAASSRARRSVMSAQARCITDGSGSSRSTQATAHPPPPSRAAAAWWPSSASWAEQQWRRRRPPAGSLAINRCESFLVGLVCE